MCQGVSIHLSNISEQDIARYQLADRIVSRGGECKELHFMYGKRPAELPVVYSGQLIVCEWGNRGRSRLPRSGWCSMEALEAGKWRELQPERVQIPASFGFERGVWYQITQGIRGVLVRDERERLHAYVLTTQASHYYQIMTRSSRMPVLIEQEI